MNGIDEFTLEYAPYVLGGVRVRLA